MKKKFKINVHRFKKELYGVYCKYLEVYAQGEKLEEAWKEWEHLYKHMKKYHSKSNPKNAMGYALELKKRFKKLEK